MTGVFGPEYAGAYDAIYAEKDYEAEVDLIERAAARFGEGPAGAVLDLGCGTGGHAVPLARRGHRVTGVDRSPAMLAAAAAKAAAAGVQVELIEGDVRHVRAGRSFDVVAMMFAVLGYQHGDADVRAALETCAVHLRPGGVLVLDAWHGPAVIAQRPEVRARTFPTADGELERVSSGALDAERDLCTVRLRVVERRAGAVVREVEEEHVMRYFFVDRLTGELRRAGLEPLSFTPFPELDGELGPEHWNLVAVARKP